VVFAGMYALAPNILDALKIVKPHVVAGEFDPPVTRVKMIELPNTSPAAKAYSNRRVPTPKKWLSGTGRKQPGSPRAAALKGGRRLPGIKRSSPHHWRSFRPKTRLRLRSSRVRRGQRR
jgi:hypothetical protein